MQNSNSRYTLTTVWETEVKCLTVPNAANNERVDPARGRECQQSARVPWVRETRVRVMAVGVIETGPWIGRRDPWKIERMAWIR